jgi:hypothetical protein
VRLACGIGRALAGSFCQLLRDCSTRDERYGAVVMRDVRHLIALCVVLSSTRLGAQTSPAQGAAQAAVSAVAVVTAGAASTAVTAAPAAATIIVAMPVVQAPRLDPPGNLRLTNLSTRARVTAENPLIAGFAIRGTTSRTMLVRAAGPALTAFGVPDTVATPRLRLHDATGAVVAENTGWSSAPLAATAIAITGAFPFSADSADSALVATLAPGNYSAEVIAGSGVGGVALVEVYDVDGSADGSHLSNVSTLGTVSPNGGEVISGFVVVGTGTRQYLIRGVGPGLKKVGVGGVLNDPTFTVFNSAGNQIASNDDWSGDGKANAIRAVAAPASGSDTVIATINRDLVALASQLTGAFALDLSSTDAALVVTLVPGAYTVQLKGLGTPVITTMPSAGAATGTSSGTGTVTPTVPVQVISVGIAPPAAGVALLEIYELP